MTRVATTPIADDALIGDLHTAAAPSVDIDAVLDEKQVAAVVGIALVINTWNRIAIASHYPVAP